MKWVLYKAPYVDAMDFAVLMALAERCGGEQADFEGAYPSRATLAKTLGLSTRTVQRRLQGLEKAGLIKRGDQSLPYKQHPNRRTWVKQPPTVYDLCKEQVRPEEWHLERKARNSPAAKRRGDTVQSPHDTVQSPHDTAESINGVTQLSPTRGDTAVSHKPPVNLPVNSPPPIAPPGGTESRGWCKDHIGLPDHQVPNCVACLRLRNQYQEAQQEHERQIERDERQRIRDARNCDTCEPGGWRYGLTLKNRIYHQVKCWHTEADALEAEQCRQWEREGHQYPPTEETA